VKVVFLVHDESEGFMPLEDRARIFHTGYLPRPILSNIQTLRQARRLSAAEQCVFTACEPLRRKGAEISVKLYSARLRNIINEYAQSEHVPVLVMRPAHGNPAIRLLHRLASIFHITGSPDLGSVVLIHPTGRLQA
jgi:hypothetical protein